MSKAPTFREAGRAWEETLATTIQRNGRPLSENTQRIYTATLNRLIERIGTQHLPVSNRLLRDYIAGMRSKYSAGVIVADLGVVLLVHKSVTDDNGNCRYPLIINHEFCKTPIVNTEDQETPCATREEVERGLAASGFLAGFVAIAAGCGLRIGEILNIHVVDATTDGKNAWDADSLTIHVRTDLKSPSAARSIYLPADLNMFLIGWYRGLGSKPRPGARLFQVSRSEVYRQLRLAGLQSAHSFRRFRATEWDEAGMNAKVSETLMEHSHGTKVRDRYIKTGEKQDFIRAEIERCGLGFNLPTVVAPFTEPVQEREEVSA
jgi:hypothetical protein